MKPLVVTTTVSSKDNAQKLASALVENRLAACANIIGPIRSLYFWEGKVQDDEEFKLFIKTTDAKWEELLAFVKSNHEYSVPELTAIDAEKMNPDYQQWLLDYVS